MPVMYNTFEKVFFISYRPPLIAYTGCQIHMSIFICLCQTDLVFIWQPAPAYTF